MSSIVEFFTSIDQVIDKNAQQRNEKKTRCNLVIEIIGLLMKIFSEKMSNKAHARTAVKLWRGRDAVSITWLLKMTGSRIKYTA